MAGDLVRLEFEATEEGVVDLGGIESLRPLPRLPAAVGVLLTDACVVEDVDDEALFAADRPAVIEANNAAEGGFGGFSLDFSFMTDERPPPLNLDPFVRFSAIRSLGTNSS